MKFVKLLGHAQVNGVLRSPADGVLHLDGDEADRLITRKLAVDVSADFSEEDHASVPVERISTVDTQPQAAVATDPADPQLASSVPVKPEDADRATGQ